MSPSRVALGAIVFVAGVASAGCHYGAISTTNTEYRSQEFADPWEQAARESAARDLRCSSDLQVGTLRDGKFPHAEYMVDGCAQRVVYKCAPASLTQTCRMQLEAKFAK